MASVDSDSRLISSIHHGYVYRLWKYDNTAQPAHLVYHQLETDPSAVAVSRIRRIFYCRRKIIRLAENLPNFYRL